jgi:hypothetical protein
MKIGWIALFVLLVQVCKAAPVAFWATDDLERVGRRDHARPVENIELAGARGETLGFQIVLGGSRTDLLKCRVELLGMKGEIYRQHYVNIKNSSWNAPIPVGDFPDPLVRAGGVVPGNLLPGEESQNQPFWVDLAIPRDALAGVVTGEIRLIQGAEHRSLPVRLTIWPFALPETPFLQTSFGASWRRIAQLHNFKADQRDRKLRSVVDSYFALLAAHQISPDEPMPYEIEVADDGSIKQFDLAGYRDYVKRYRVSSLRIPFWPQWPFRDPLGKDRPAALRYLASVGQMFVKEGWEEKLFFSSDVDEPDDAAAYESVRRWGQFLNDLQRHHGIRLRHLVTESPVAQEKAWGSLHGHVQTWVIPMTDLWNDERRGKEWQQHQQNGEQTWAYAAMSYYPDAFYATYGKPPLRLKDRHPLTWQIDFMPINFRLAGWLCASQGHRGLLYWDTLHWPDGEDPWQNPATFVQGGRVYNGDGMLVYPGQDGPCASLRLKWIRDGIQDHALLMLAKKSAPNQFAEACRAVCPGVAEWSADPAALRKQRMMLGRVLADKRK